MVCTNRKITLVDLPPTSAAVEEHLLQGYYFTSIKASWYYKINATTS